ncbi:MULTISPECIES: rhodanese-like domain-containing protein [Halorubrum]|uniref:Rhodanese n=1 Tax=Halorubrum persicum TaxID=1383844 RepID=A0A2G1WIJ4_9EURY|nr:rhodanese-like domain-containing protein [Halorubrum persicum]PHQ38821.1 rhodanese [Halorubrum persicum]
MDGEIDPDELAALLDGADRDSGGVESAERALRIVDIRDRRAFDRGHVPESECIPFPELTTRVPELEGAARIVTVCPHGVASRQAAQLIGSYAGTDARVESLRGGIEAWERDAGELVPTAAADDGTGGDAGPDADEGPDAPF